jgi:hypothetical protein
MIVYKWVFFFYRNKTVKITNCKKKTNLVSNISEKQDFTQNIEDQ